MTDVSTSTDTTVGDSDTRPAADRAGVRGHPRGRGPRVRAGCRDRAACAEVAGAVVEEFGGLDVLASNAGIYPQARIVDMTGEDIDLIFDVNVKGTIHAVQAAQIGFVRPVAIELARHGTTAPGAPSRTPASRRSARP